MRHYFLSFLLVISSFLSNSQVLNTKVEKQNIPFSDNIIVDDKTQQIRFVSFKPQKITKDWENGNWIKDHFFFSGNEEIRFVKVDKDQIGKYHYRYKKFFNNFPLENSEIIAHVSENYLESINGNLNSVNFGNSTFELLPYSAFQLALKQVNADRYVWQDKEQFEFLKRTGSLKGDSITEIEKVYITDSKGFYQAAYKIDVYAIAPLSRANVYIDARTGNVLYVNTKIHFADKTATGNTKYSGVQSFTTDQVASNSYRLRETKRGGGIQTLNMLTGTDYSAAVDFTDSDNNWTNINSSQDEAALDVHWGTELYYDYFLNTFQRNSYDNSGAPLMSYVHYDKNYLNAFWNGSAMTYGDGDITTMSALTSIDVVCHELTHAITEHTAGLNYQDESGALNESFSDIFGTVLEYKGNPANADFLIGEDLSPTHRPFRSMVSPKVCGDPDTYQGTNWVTGTSDNGGVHTNSGVQNHWFYLLSEGGSGVNDLNNSYTVKGIGIDKAAAITYRSLSTYLTSNSQYIDARTYSIQAAIDLYGACSQEVLSVSNAWYAVGVGTIGAPTKITADFTVSQTSSCSFPVTLTFTNLSSNATSYKWDFGDLSTTTATNPAHIYQNPGVYDVKLIAKGNASCGNSDTLVKKAYITVFNGGGPKSISCQPSTTSACCGNGISNVKFNTIDNATLGGVDSYKDYSCSNITSVVSGKTYPFTVKLGNTTNEFVRIYIDYDNSGDFNNSNELVYNGNVAKLTHTGNIKIPAVNDYDTPLRMRVISDSYILINSCNNVTVGQVEDYTVFISENKSPSQADFVVDNSVLNVNQTANFTDLSTNVPTSWKWILPGATPATSTLQNPSVVYSQKGVFDATLIVSNAYGTDTIVKKRYITVADNFNMCTATKSNLLSGNLFDSGGNTSNYGINQNCSFLIDPGCIGSVIDLTINEFSTQLGIDILTIYDGGDATGKILFSESGATNVSKVTSTSGKMFLQFKSDATTVDRGFYLSWNAVIPSSKPIAGFKISDTLAPINIAVQFTDSSKNYPYSWKWDFGDNTGSTISSPTHLYTKPGKYDVKLIVTNCYSSDTLIQKIHIQEAPIYAQSTDTIYAQILHCNDSLELPFTIYNKGLGDLVWKQIYSNTVVENFDSGTLNPIWNTILGGTVGNLCGVKSGTQALYFNGATQRSIISTPLNLTNTSTFDFNLKISNGSNGCEQADNGEDVLLSYSIDNGVNWLTINTFKVTNYPSFTQISQQIPTQAKTSSTLLKLHQPSFSGAGYDNWVIDDLKLDVTINKLDRIQLTEDSARVSQNDSSKIKLLINASGMNAGTYNYTLRLASNDTLHKINNLYVKLTLIGEPILVLENKCVTFDTATVGFEYQKTFKIYNKGCEALKIKSLTSLNPDFTLNNSISDIAPGDSSSIIVKFKPSGSLGVVNGQIKVVSNMKDTSICLSSYVLPSPKFDIKIDTIEHTFYSCNDSVSLPFKIYNKGLGKLNWQLKDSSVNYTDNFETGTMASFWSSINGAQFNNSCGTNLYSNVACAFNDSPVRSAVTKPLNLSDGGSIAFYLKISNGTNGCEQADPGEDVMLSYSTDNGNTWNKINTYNVSNYPNFTLIKESIPANSKTANTLLKIDQPVFSGIGYDNWVIDDVTITSTLSTIKVESIPNSGRVDASDSSIVNLKVKTDGLVNGLSYANLIYESNDPLNPFEHIVLNIKIITSPEISFNKTCLDFGNLYLGGSKLDSILIQNDGCDTLKISQFNIKSQDFKTNIQSVTIAPRSNYYLPITFFANTLGKQSNTIDIKSNTRDTTICLKANVLAYPHFKFSPDTLRFEITSCSDSLIKSSFQIENQFGDTLKWDIENQIIFDDFEDGGNINLWQAAQGVQLDNICGTSSGNYALRFDDQIREVITNNFQINEGYSISFDLKMPNGSTGCDQAETGEEVYLAVSTDNGASWTDFYTFDVASCPDFRHFVIPIPTIGQTANSQFKLYQTNNSGLGQDNWVVDNFAINDSMNVLASQFSGKLLSGNKQDLDVYIPSTKAALRSGSFSFKLNTNDPNHTQVIIPCKIVDKSIPCPKSNIQLVDKCLNQYAFEDVSPSLSINKVSWDFGDGYSTTGSFTTHSYASGGVYEVKMKVCSNFGCDSVITTVVADDVYSLTPAICTPFTYVNCCDLGIVNVELNTLSNSSQNADEGYVDFSCTKGTELTLGSKYKMSITTSNINQEHVFVLIDFDNNGDFSSNELVMNSFLVKNHEDSIELSNTSVLNIPLRMRIISSTDTILNFCDSIKYGQAEDYTVIIKNAPVPLSANFSFEPINLCFPTSVFKDDSKGNIKSWNWDFGDGTFSEIQNPTHTFLPNKTYNVRLIIKNDTESDTIFKQVVFGDYAALKVKIDGSVKLGSLLLFSTNINSTKSVLWDFGDGYSSTVKNAKHVYLDSGNFTLNVKVTDTNNCNYVYTSKLDVFKNSANETVSNEKSMLIASNPSDGIFNFMYKYLEKGEIILSVKDEVGNIILNESFENETTGVKKIDLSMFSEGIYFLTVEYQDEIKMFKLYLTK